MDQLESHRTSTAVYSIWESGSLEAFLPLEVGSCIKQFDGLPRKLCLKKCFHKGTFLSVVLANSPQPIPMAQNENYAVALVTPGDDISCKELSLVRVFGLSTMPSPFCTPRKSKCTLGSGYSSHPLLLGARGAQLLNYPVAYRVHLLRKFWTSNLSLHHTDEYKVP